MVWLQIWQPYGLEADLASGHPPGGRSRPLTLIGISGGRVWHPAGVRFVSWLDPGVSLALAPRLLSGNPPGWRKRPGAGEKAILGRRSSDRPTGETAIFWRGGKAGPLLRSLN